MTFIQFRPGVKIDQATQVIDRQAMEAGNGRGWGSGQPVREQMNHYFQWTDNAERQLGSVLAPGEAQALVFTQTYWALRTSPLDGVRLNTLIEREYESRQQALQQLAERLRAQSSRWERQAAPLVIPDTNMFLDKDETIDQIDWTMAADSNMEVRLVVPLIVIHELDRLKRQGNGTTAQAARAAIRWLACALPPEGEARSERFERQGRGATTVEAYLHDGPTRPPDADAVIIDVCKWLTTVSSLPVTLVTKDLNMSLRATAADVTVTYLEKGAQGSVPARRS